MTTSPDTLNSAEATTAADATTANQATLRPPGPPGELSLRPPEPSHPAQKARPDLEEEPISSAQRFLVGLFVAVPLVALVAAIPLMWGWGLGWHDVLIALASTGYPDSA